MKDEPEKAKVKLSQLSIYSEFMNMKTYLDQEDASLVIKSAIKITDFFSKQNPNHIVQDFQKIKEALIIEDNELHKNLAFSEAFFETVTKDFQDKTAIQDEKGYDFRAEIMLLTKVKTGISIYTDLIGGEKYKEQVVPLRDKKTNVEIPQIHINAKSVETINEAFKAEFCAIHLFKDSNAYLIYLKEKFLKEILKLNNKNINISDMDLYTHAKSMKKSDKQYSLSRKYIAIYDMRETLLSNKHTIQQLTDFSKELNKSFVVLEKIRHNKVLKIFLTLLALPSLIVGTSLIKKIWAVQGKKLTSNLNNTLYHFKKDKTGSNNIEEGGVNKNQP